MFFWAVGFTSNPVYLRVFFTIDRTMYLTSLYGGGIIKAAMDGSNHTTIVAGWGIAVGITIDTHSSKLYWANYADDEIQSCGLDGSGIETVAKLSSAPLGMAMVDQRLYWGLHNEKRVESRATTGGNISSFYCDGAGKILQLTSADWSLQVNQTNQCEGQTCVGVCVLSRTNFRCMVWGVS